MLSFEYSVNGVSSQYEFTYSSLRDSFWLNRCGVHDMFSFEYSVNGVSSQYEFTYSYIRVYIRLHTLHYVIPFG
jgi:hypothetical protein